MPTATVLFVCLHGAAKSRLAAAWFNRFPPAGWRATSAGVEPQARVNSAAAALVAGTGADARFERSPPRAVATGAADMVVAIDCEVPGAQLWTLIHPMIDAAMHVALRARVAAFARTFDEGNA